MRVDAPNLKSKIHIKQIMNTNQVAATAAMTSMDGGTVKHTKQDSKSKDGCSIAQQPNYLQVDELNDHMIPTDHLSNDYCSYLENHNRSQEKAAAPFQKQVPPTICPSGNNVIIASQQMNKDQSNHKHDQKSSREAIQGALQGNQYNTTVEEGELNISKRTPQVSERGAKISDKNKYHNGDIQETNPTGIQDMQIQYHSQTIGQQPSISTQNHDLSITLDLNNANPFQHEGVQNLIGVGTTTREKATHLNLFSNSFDESGVLQLDGMKPQRNCKSSTRIMNKTQNTGYRQVGLAGNTQQIPILQNLGGTSALSNGGHVAPTTLQLTSESLNLKQDAFNNYMKQKQQSGQTNQYQQALMGQIHRSSNCNSFDIKVPSIPQLALNQIQIANQDLSNRSHLVHYSGALANMAPYSMNIGQIQAPPYSSQGYGGSSSGGNSSKPVTPHQQNQFQSIILSAGSNGNSMNRLQQTPQSQNSNNMDPYTYFRWKQQKYKSSRSIQANNGGVIGQAQNNQGSNENQIQRQNSNNSIMNNSQQIMIGNPYPQFQHFINKGNQTQKHNKSSCSSGHGSIINTSSTGLTMGGQMYKSLQEVSNPQYFISLRFSERKVSELTGLNAFKNLSDLDISGNMLTNEIQELKCLSFLKKLNLSNNMITELYPLPSNLEILNLSYNKLKSFKPEVISNLKNVTTLDISQNGLENLEGIQSIKRLKRLLSKNNQIQDLSPLNQLETIVEIDLENNPVDNLQSVLVMLANKKDILVLNLKLSPVFLTISNYDQLLSEMESSTTIHDQLKIESIQEEEKGEKAKIQNPLIESFKNKLKHYHSGCLYRSKRVYHKMRHLQQQTKRSSSQFSNGSSSCGRVNGTAGVNTGGRALGTNQMSSHGNPLFSPLLNNTHNNVTTPNQGGGYHATQRLEDIEQLYDEILDEEEEHERKLMKIQRRKLKKMGISDPNHNDDDSVDEEDYEESMSMYEEEDEDYIHPTMSFEEDIDDLQSYRNHHNQMGPQDHHADGSNDFLNESTADFNKEIRQINEELRQQFGNDLNIPGQPGINSQVPDHLQSFQSTQSLLNNPNIKNNNSGGAGECSQPNTQKKNPISFKLDLSKCTNQQSEEDDDEFEATACEEQDANFDIPGLQFVKVTDDSFRQYKNNQKQSNQQTQPIVSNNLSSKRETKEQIAVHNQINNTSTSGIEKQKSNNQKASLNQNIEIIPKPQQPPKQIIIPKLQLGILQQHQPIPLKQQNIIISGQVKNLSAISSLRSGKQTAKSKNQETITIVKDNHASLPSGKQVSIPLVENSKCQLEECLKMRQILKNYEAERDSLFKELKVLRTVIDEIKSIFKFSARGDIMRLPEIIRDFKNTSVLQCDKMSWELQTVNQMCSELQEWKRDQVSKMETFERNKDLQQMQVQQQNKEISELKYQIEELLQKSKPQNESSGKLSLVVAAIKEATVNQQSDAQDALIKTTNSSINDQTQPLVKQFVEANQLVVNQQRLSSRRGGKDQSVTEDQKKATRKNVINDQKNTNNTGKKKQQINQQHQEVKKQKRPQSVVTGMNQRRSSQGVKLNNLMKVDQSLINNNNFTLKDDHSCDANEYCSNHDLMLPIDLSAIATVCGGNSQESKATPLSRTMNRKVGHYLQRLKERNSSLQERLNGSFREGSGSHSAVNIIQSPLPHGANIAVLNFKQIQNQQDTANPYILSPNRHQQNESISSYKPTIQTALQGYQSVQLENPQQFNLNNQNLSKQMPLEISSAAQFANSLNFGNGLLQKITNKEFGAPCSNTRRYSQYNSSGRQFQAGQNLRDQVGPTTVSQPILRLQQNVTGLVTNDSSECDLSVTNANKPLSPTQALVPPSQPLPNSKQHSKTQRIHINRVQYNQFMSNNGSAVSKSILSGINSSMSKEGQLIKASYELSQPLIQPSSNPQGYQTHQPISQHQASQNLGGNVSQVISGRLLRQDSSSQEHTVVRRTPSHHIPIAVPSAVANLTQTSNTSGTYSQQPQAVTVSTFYHSQNNKEK